MKKLLLFLGLLFLQFDTIAQNELAFLTGRLADKDNPYGFEDFQLFIPKKKQLYAVDTNGVFEISSMPYGTFTIQVLFQNELIDSFKVAVNAPRIDLGSIFVSNPNKILAREIQATASSVLLEADIETQEDDGAMNNQNISILLHSSANRDPFLSAAGFVFGQYNFRTRGYNKASQQILMNGISMNDLNSGNPSWAQWSGLNDVLKNPVSSYGLATHQQAFGLVNGATAFELNAADMSAQHKFTYSVANRGYHHRVMYTHSTGLNKKYWAFTFSASRRWAVEGYIPGTSLDAYSGLFSVTKVVNSRHQFSLNLVASPSTRARSGTAVDEVYDLAGNHYYNPNWGWQDGKIRNARLSKSELPFAVLQHSYSPSDNTRINSSFFYQMGSNQSTSLDWYNAIDPRPDYYQNLPGMYQSANPIAAKEIEEQLRQNPEQLQIDWSRLYSANRNNFETLYNRNGMAGDSLQGRRSLYVIGADVEQLKKAGLAMNIAQRYSDKIIWSGGLQAMGQYSTFFRRLEDLLGGDYFLNYNSFAAQQFPSNKSYLQNDLNKPNTAVLKGDQYKYYFEAKNQKAWLWAQQEVNLKKLSLHTSIQAGFSAFQRNGRYRNGLVPDHSFGKSEMQSFITYAAKGGLTYKINGRNYLVLNGFYSADEPSFNHVFIAPRTCNQTIDKPGLQYTQSAEGGYILHAPKLNIRAMGYVTDIKNSVSIQRFYNDEPEYQSFVNFVMRNINTRNIGTELAIEYCLNSMISVNAVAALGQAFYTNKPSVSVYNDNDTNLNAKSKEVFIKNYYLGVGPQSAYTSGIAYNAKKYWYIKINANYFDRNYVAVNPARRSVEAAELIQHTDSLFGRIFNQEQLAAFFTLDISGGKSIKLYKLSDKFSYKTSLYINFSINNLLNNQSIKSSGFEQLRYDFTHNNPDKFPRKYVYAPGRTFLINLSLKF
ncbi:MAG: TonB-dependent receptor [Bacteroidota bacterium]